MDEEKKQDDYEFLKETIKAKPIDKKKLAKQIGRLAGAGLLPGRGQLLHLAVSPGLQRLRGSAAAGEPPSVQRRPLSG